MRLIKILLFSTFTLISFNLKAQYDVDAQKNFTASGITNATIKCAINRLVIGLKDSSLWSKMVAIYHMAGGDAIKNSYNLKDTSAHKLTYTGTLYHSATGVKSDAVTGKINTNCPSNVTGTGQNSMALSFYSRDNIQYGTTDMYALYNTYNWLYIRNMGDNALIGTHSAYKAINNTNSSGLFTSSRTASNLTTLYRNGVVLDTSSIASVSPDATNVQIFNYDGQSTVTRECRFASISDGLTATEARKLKNVVDSFIYYLDHGASCITGGDSIPPVPTGSDSNWVRSGNNIYFNNGNVGIGTTNPHQKLSVNGTVLATKVKVSIDTTDWADFVFDKNYKIPSLEETENYIKLHQHLPGIPSANEVGKNGLDLGVNQALLLQKIEELTLIIIQQNKTQGNLKRLIDKQHSRIKVLEKKSNHE